MCVWRGLGISFCNKQMGNGKSILRAKGKRIGLLQSFRLFILISFVMNNNSCSNWSFLPFSKRFATYEVAVVNPSLNWLDFFIKNLKVTLS